MYIYWIMIKGMTMSGSHHFSIIIISYHNDLRPHSFVEISRKCISLDSSLPALFLPFSVSLLSTLVSKSATTWRLLYHSDFTITTTLWPVVHQLSEAGEGPKSMAFYTHSVILSILSFARANTQANLMQPQMEKLNESMSWAINTPIVISIADAVFW